MPIIESDRPTSELCFISLTIKDLEQLQSQNPDFRMELVEGNIIVMGPSDYESDEIGSRLLTFLNIWVMPRKLGRVTGTEQRSQRKLQPENR